MRRLIGVSHAMAVSNSVVTMLFVLLCPLSTMAQDVEKPPAAPHSAAAPSLAEEATRDLVAWVADGTPLPGFGGFFHLYECFGKQPDPPTKYIFICTYLPGTITLSHNPLVSRAKKAPEQSQLGPTALVLEIRLVKADPESVLLCLMGPTASCYGQYRFSRKDGVLSVRVLPRIVL